MVWLFLAYIIGFLLVACFKRLKWNLETFMDCNTGGIICTAVVILIIFFTNGIKADYKNDIECYQIKEISDNTYYIEDRKQDEILVFPERGTKWKTISRKNVKFQPTEGPAAVQIKIRKIKEPSNAETWLFFKSSYGMEKKIIESCTIYIPE